jgi:hypothetical protein
MPPRSGCRQEHVLQAHCAAPLGVESYSSPALAPDSPPPGVWSSNRRTAPSRRIEALASLRASQRIVPPQCTGYRAQCDPLYRWDRPTALHCKAAAGTRALRVVRRRSETVAPWPYAQRRLPAGRPGQGPHGPPTLSSMSSRFGAGPCIRPAAVAGVFDSLGYRPRSTANRHRNSRRSSLPRATALGALAPALPGVREKNIHTRGGKERNDSPVRLNSGLEGVVPRTDGSPASRWPA